jgi:hypothetical protein
VAAECSPNVPHRFCGPNVAHPPYPLGTWVAGANDVVTDGGTGGCAGGSALDQASACAATLMLNGVINWTNPDYVRLLCSICCCLFASFLDLNVVLRRERVCLKIASPWPRCSAFWLRSSPRL